MLKQITYTTLLLTGMAAGAVVPPDAGRLREAEEWADDKLSELTLEEKLRLTRGHSEFFFPGVPEKGIPYVYLSDATQGVHIRRNLKDTVTVRQLEKSVAFPAPVMLSASFDNELAADYGRAVGEECRAGGIGVLLGPGVNIARNSQCGRNYEYFGEDPLLTGEIASAYVRGLQSTGTAACVKHFLCNGTEFYRRRSNSVVDSRALREIYLPPFKKCIDAGVAFVMTSYNRLNGEWTGQSHAAIDSLLRGELGFRNAVMSDWSSVYDMEKVVRSGQNMVMPGSSRQARDLERLVKEGKVTESDLDRMIRPLLTTCRAYGLYDRPAASERNCDFDAHCSVAEKTAAEGTVLLRNRSLLPLAGNLRILATGSHMDRNPRNCDNPASSADVEGFGYISLRDALKTEFGDSISFAENPSEDELRDADVVITTVGTVDMESFERPFALPRDEEKRIKSTVASNPNTVVIVFSGSGIKMTGWADDTAALLYGWYPGQNGMRAIAGILSGRVAPSGKLPITIERDFKDSPAKNTMPQGAEFYNTAFRAYNEKLIELYDVVYSESVLTGYRWYDTRDIEPLFPFGHGLTYTDWKLSGLKAKVTGDRLTVSLEVANTGRKDGTQVVQIYTSEEKPTVTRPAKELKAYRRVSLRPGERRRVEFSIPLSDLAFWDDTADRFRLNGGSYTILAGTSSRDIADSVKINVKQQH